jgi:hypothetical protein
MSTSGVVKKYHSLFVTDKIQDNFYTIDNDGVLYKCVLETDDEEKIFTVRKLYKIGLRYGKIGYKNGKFDSEIYNETLCTKVMREIDTN